LPLTAKDMAPGSLYLSPRGRVCMLLAPPLHGPHSAGDVLMFAYLRRDGQRSVEDGFTLASANAGVMRLFAQASAAGGEA